MPIDQTGNDKPAAAIDPSSIRGGTCGYVVIPADRNKAAISDRHG
jgi:hypothetical protein